MKSRKQKKTSEKNEAQLKGTWKWRLILTTYLSGEEGVTPQQLGEDATDTPQVHRVAVQAVGAEHQLRRAVPPRYHMLGHGVVHL